MIAFCLILDLLIVTGVAQYGSALQAAIAFAVLLRWELGRARDCAGH